jgi:glycosyltransferase involved in cell wall biosynthesis/GT2 family glycosyltransferase
VPAAALARFIGPVRVLGEDGRELAGSPLDPGAVARGARAVARLIARRAPLIGTAEAADGLELAAMPAGPGGPPARASPAPGRQVAVVVPVAGDAARVGACLAAVLATVPAGTELLVVDDATPGPELAEALGLLHRQRRIRLLRHQRALGPVAAANTGLRAAARLPGGRDVVLLDGCALVAPGWLQRLRAAVHAAPDIGSAAPLSNGDGFVSYSAPVPERAARALGGATVELPGAAGPCLYLRRECLRATGLLRPGMFAAGHGAIEDFGLRARHLGWRHVGVPGACVAAPRGEASDAAKMALLERLHPGYRRLVAEFHRADPLAGARRLLDTARWKAGRGRAGAVLLVSHDGGGGVERALAARCAAIRAEGRRAVVLRPVLAAGGGERRYRPGLCVVGDGVEGGFSDLRFRLPEELGALARLLRADRPAALEVHHLLGHAHAVTGLAARLGIPTEWHVHDYAAFCPRITLVGPGGRYCGEPERVEVCEACIADCGAAIEEEIGVAALRARSAADFAAARRVVVPAEDVAARLRRHFPAIAPVVVPLEDDRRLPRVAMQPRRARRLVCVIGAIGPVKGYEVLLDCARDAAWRGLPLEFVLAGHSPDDARLIASGRIAVTGPYREAEAEALVRGLGADLAWLPSIWPETWCYTLGAAWRAGLRVAAFDIGAPAERIRRTGRGWLLPLGLPAAAVNNALLAVNLAAGDV